MKGRVVIHFIRGQEAAPAGYRLSVYGQRKPGGVRTFSTIAELLRALNRANVNLEQGANLTPRYHGQTQLLYCEELELNSGQLAILLPD